MQVPNNEQLKTLLEEGVGDAIDRQMNNDADRVFAGRMATRLNWALIRIRELEARAVEDSWRGEVDRMSGAFSADEIARARDPGWR